MSRKPTDAEFDSYTGMHCSTIWKRLPPDWQCPVCERTKREILQWGKCTGSNALLYSRTGWKAGIHRHHDHGASFGKGRFKDIHICGACNWLDARLKKRAGASGSFSFSLEEMKTCLISARPNEALRDADIRYDRAIEIYAIRRLLPRN